MAHKENNNYNSSFQSLRDCLSKWLMELWFSKNKKDCFIKNWMTNGQRFRMKVLKWLMGTR
jgi:hypothetical protein